MSEAISPTGEVTPPAGRHITYYFGAALIGLGLIAPFIASGLGYGDARSAGIGLTQSLGACLLWGFIAWLVTRKGSDAAKGKGLVTVGILVCLTAYTSITINQKEDEIGKQFLRDSIALEANHRTNVAALNERFGKVSLDPYLVPEALTSKERVVAGQSVLKEYRSLLQQRNDLFHTYMKSVSTLIGALPEGALRSGAESKAAAKLQGAQSIVKEVDTTQLAHADAVEALFKWAEKNNGRMSSKGGKVIFQSQQLLSEFQSLAATLDTTAVRANVAFGAAQAEAAKAEASREQSLKKAKALLE